MVTVLRAVGLRAVIFTNDHEPAHVHVFGGGEAEDQPPWRRWSSQLVWGYSGMTDEVRRALRIVAENQALLLARWENIHG